MGSAASLAIQGDIVEPTPMIFRTVLIATLLVTALPPRGLCSSDSFLGLSFGARPIALGGAYTAVADDLHAATWNPAGLAAVDRPALAGSQNHLTFTDNVYSITLAAPVGRFGALALSASHLSIANAALTRPVLDATGNPVLDSSTGQPLVELTGFGQENDASFSLGWGGRAGPISAGVSGRVLTGKAGAVLGVGMGGDAGILLHLPAGFAIGFVV